MKNNKAPLILIVDDYPKNLQILGNILRGNNYRTAFAKSGPIALESIKEEKPDIILLDIMMPDMDGFEVCARLKKNPETADIPVIFVTALSDMDKKIEAFKAGGVDYILKPIQQEEVFERIKTHLLIRSQKQELLALNERLQDSNEELQNINRTKDKLFSIIGHDLRGPLSNINNLLKLILEGVLDKEEREELLTETMKSVKLTYDLLENLLFWAKNQRNEIDFRPSNCDITTVVDDNIALQESAARDKNISLRAEYTPGLKAFADKHMLNIIMRNLISNAIKFTHEGGHIIVLVSESANEVKVSVQDDGVGISEENIEKIFDSVQSFTTRGTRHEKGTGLGLILTKDFVQKNGGKLHLTSQVDKGSTFSFTLPQATPEQ